MFEIGILALCTAIEAGVFDERWQFTGIGSVDKEERIHLVRGRSINIQRRQSQKQYSEILRCHDLGLSLMYTPHPSLVPIEMASSAMVVVTNTFSNKTKEALRAISENFLGVEPTVEGIVSGLREATARVEQCDERVAASQVKWCKDWSESFNDGFMDRVKAFLKEAQG